ncbi:MAG: hypothetical protein ACI80I_001630, partial [Akkermansiaceae bacterium]
QIDHEAELFLSGLWQFGHVRSALLMSEWGPAPIPPGYF